MVNVFMMKFQGLSASSSIGRLILEVVAVALLCFVRMRNNEWHECASLYFLSIISASRILFQYRVLLVLLHQHRDVYTVSATRPTTRHQLS
jgi:hypothetical protein